MVRQLVEVALDVAGGQRRRAVGEQRVDVVPREQRTVVAARYRLLVGMLWEQRGYAGDGPRLGLADVNETRGTLEVVNVRGVVLCAAGRSCYELCKFARERNLRGLRAVE